MGSSRTCTVSCIILGNETVGPKNEPHLQRSVAVKFTSKFIDVHVEDVEVMLSDCSRRDLLGGL